MKYVIWVLALASVNAFAQGKHFDRAVFVIFENTDYADAVAEPFLGRLANEGASFTSMLALTHPSQGNYIALTSGDLNGVGGDGEYDLDVRNVVDLLEAKGLDWRVYAEDYPGDCFTGNRGNYVRKHNPMISYLDVQSSPSRCAKIVNASQFETDAKNGKLPPYVMFIPNLKNDGHDTSVTYADKWYQKRFGPLYADPSFMAGTVLISTFDESGGFLGRNQIYTSIAGPAVKPGGIETPLTTVSLLKLVEDNWDLGNLGSGDVDATPVPETIWR